MRRQHQVQKFRKPKQPKSVKHQQQQEENDDDGIEVVSVFALDDMRLSKANLDTIFDRLKTITEHRPEMVSHLEEVLAYFSTSKKRRRWNDESITRPTHIIVAWDQRTPRMRLLARKNPFELILDVAIVSSITCFMFYTLSQHTVHLLNWNYINTEEPGDDYLPHLTASIAFLKENYLTPLSQYKFFSIDLLPIYETLTWFLLFANFAIMPQSSHTTQQDQFLSIVNATRDLTKIRQVVENPAYRVKNKEGQEVIQLHYMAKPCCCSIKKMLENEAHLLSAYQCGVCFDVYYCNHKCNFWQGCKCSGTR